MLNRFVYPLIILCVSSYTLSIPLSDITPCSVTVEIKDFEVENATKHEDVQRHELGKNDLRAIVCPDDPINWQPDVDVKCTANVLLSIGHCVTYDGKNSLYEIKCPYFQAKGHQISTGYSEAGYIKLPDDISELNDYMCGPMNRKGFLCEECIGNFSLSMTSMGNKCSNCTDVLYGIPLYLLVELVPITGFYLLIFIFQIHITSPPMVSFIFYSQAFMYYMVVDRPPPLEKVVPQYENNFWCNLNLFVYSPWNLDFIRYILPPFCVFEGLSMKYVAILSYVSVVYPLVLILVTWVCIELHGRGFKPIACIVVIFHKCLAKLKQDWGDKRDVVDVFSAFFLLSYSKLMYQSSLFLVCDKVTHLHGMRGHWGVKYIMKYDSNVLCGSSMHVTIAVVSVQIIFVFSVLPALLLTLYPFKIVRSCLSKCRLDTLCLSAFMDKFHGCYRNGLNGGRDVRSFAGLYFFIRVLLFLYYPCQLYKITFSFGSYLVLIFLSATLLIAIVRPYKESYMNVFDTVILGHFYYVHVQDTN